MSRKKEAKVYGRAACRALFERRPNAIIRVYLLPGLKRELSPLLDHCREHKLAYHVVEEEELRKVAGATHHEGVCILARALAPKRGVEAIARSPVVVLDGVTNPYNVGAVLRSAAHFGVRALLVDDRVRLTPAAMRVAEGGAEHVPLVQVNALAPALERLASDGWDVVATTSHRAPSVYDAELGPRVVLVIGSEGEGLSPEVGAACTKAVRIPGTGKVESLNVSVATGVLLAELGRRSKSKSNPRGRRRDRKRSRT